MKTKHWPIPKYILDEPPPTKAEIEEVRSECPPGSCFSIVNNQSWYYLVLFFMAKHRDGADEGMDEANSVEWENGLIEVEGEDF